MKNEIFYENLLKDRKAVLWHLAYNKSYRMAARKLRNGRALNRLSTKQLVAKMRACDKGYSKAVHNYVGWLDSFQAKAVAA